jgi:DNA-binding NarL/FixJ family response regulator
MWPVEDGSGTTRHVRVTVLAATDASSLVLGTRLVRSDVDCRGLTSSELQVLGLLVDGRSNQQIARQLTVAARTMAAHLEHRLNTRTRTLAAVRAEREGCYVPPPTSHRNVPQAN